MATRLDIRTRARIRADQDQSTFPTDTQYNYLIDEAAKEVWYDLIKAGWPITFHAATLPLSSNPMPVYQFNMEAGGDDSDPIAFVRGVYRYDGGTYVELPRLNEGDRAALTADTGGIASYHDVRVDMADGLVVEVLPYVAGTQIRVEFVREWPGFTDDTARWPGPARSDEMVVLKAAIKGCRKEGNDQGARFLEGEYEYIKECVQDMASWTNMRSPATIRDVRLARSRLPGDYDVYGPEF